MENEPYLMDWYEEETVRPGGFGWENLAMAEYKDKALTVVIDFMDGGFFARLEAIVDDLDLEKESDVKYYYRRYFFGAGEKFVKKMRDRMNSKKRELELIATGKDL